MSENSQVPTEPVAVPPGIIALVGAPSALPVWRNDLGGLTFRIDGQRYLKWAPADEPELDLAGEAKRMTWARQWVRVPRVLEQGADTEGSWLITEAIEGRSAVDPRWITEPGTACFAIGKGLRMLHETLPVPECPFDWSVEYRKLAAREEIGPPPPVDAVVCHGDACAPNTLLAEDGSVAGHVDLDALGVADRWADLAVAAWSTEWNYGPGYEDTVYRGYGIEPDPERIAYYRRLWDIT
ncbi:aminoglycoside 3'-phosphotransferase [Sciscionella sediminilitoris]|uniref:aminoglycoside 3'-phosphotransferase n=1 Tax=Sciscionella sediminilitoris TaxID=1445613 RepID=UPI0004DF9E2A|nr:aminoglycoside 3'-phosphotransferase [Sciscionella sp. SE31]